MNRSSASRYDTERTPGYRQHVHGCLPDDERAGWVAATIVMTPDKKPFFAATYIPKERPVLHERPPRPSSPHHVRVAEPAGRTSPVGGNDYVSTPASEFGHGQQCPDRFTSRRGVRGTRTAVSTRCQSGFGTARNSVPHTLHFPSRVLGRGSSGGCPFHGSQKDA